MGGVTVAENIVISGQVQPFTEGGAAVGSIVVLRDSTSKEFLAQADVMPDGTWSTSIALRPGVNYIDAVNIDTADNVGTSRALKFTYSPVTQSLFEDNGVSPTDNISSNDIIVGTGLANTKVNLIIDGIPITETVKTDAAGAWIYNPNGLSPGQHTVIATQTDAGGNLGSTTLTFTLVDNAPPTAVSLLNPLASINENSDTTAPILVATITAIDTDGRGINILNVTGPDASSFTIIGNQLFLKAGLSLNYEAKAFYDVTVTAQDSILGGTASANYHLNVNDVNDAPVAVADSFNGTENIALTMNVLANDSDVDNTLAQLTPSIVSGPTKGSLVLNLDKTFTYTPNANTSGQDSFTYKVSDGALSSNTVTVTLNIAAVNDAPVAVADSFNGTEDIALTMNVLANDSDVDNTLAQLTPSIVSGPTKGSLVLNLDKTFTYTPNANTNGQDSFTYKVSDGALSSNTVTVTLNIAAVNDAPVAAADSFNGTEDIALTMNVLANDSDVDNTLAQLTPSIVSGPTKGSLVLNLDKTFTYTPNANTNGQDSFTYKVSDGALSSNTVTVTLNIAAVNDAPVAVNDSAQLNANSSVSIGVLANDSDVEGDVLSIFQIGAPSHGTAIIDPNNSHNILYTPTSGYYGADSFSYTVKDTSGASSVATVSIDVIKPNQAPTAISLLNPLASINENSNTAAPTLIGTISVTDDGLGMNNLTLNDYTYFELVGNQLFLKAGINLDYETKSFYDVTFNVQDPTVGGILSDSYRLRVNNVNEAPTAIALQVGTSVNENSNVTRDILLGNILVTDDGLGTNVLTLSGNDTGSFKIIGTQLFLKAGVILDYETKPFYDITVNAQDSILGGTASADYRLNVRDLNEAPTAISLPNAVLSINENSSTANSLATIVVADDALGTNIITLSGADAGSFDIIGNQLFFKANVTLNFENKAAYDVTISAKDSILNGTVSTNYHLAVNDILELPPTDITLQLTTDNLYENQKGKVIGNLTTTDPDSNQGFSYIVSDPRFEVVNGQLKLAAGQSLNYEVDPEVNITITSYDQTGLSVTKPFTISVGNENELSVKPTVYGVYAETTLTSDKPVATININDTYATSSIQLAGPDAGLFTIIGNQLFLKQGTAVPAYNTKTGYDVILKVTDLLGNGDSQNFHMDIYPAKVTAINDSYNFAVPFSTSSGVHYDLGRITSLPTLILPDSNGDGVLETLSKFIDPAFLSFGTQATDRNDVTNNDLNFASSAKIISISEPLSVLGQDVGTVSVMTSTGFLTNGLPDSYLMFTPDDPNLSGKVTFNYKIQNVDGSLTSANVNMEIYKRPIGLNDVFTFNNTPPSQTSFTLDVFANDSFLNTLPSPQAAYVSQVINLATKDVIGDVLFQSGQAKLNLDAAHANFSGTASFQYVPLGLGGTYGNIDTVEVTIIRSTDIQKPTLGPAALNLGNLLYSSSNNLNLNMVTDANLLPLIVRTIPILGENNVVATSALGQNLVFQPTTSSLVGDLTFKPNQPSLVGAPNDSYIDLLLNTIGDGLGNHSITDSATIKVGDGYGSDAIITLNWTVSADNKFIFGSLNADTLNFSNNSGAVYINGFSGNDSIIGGAGNDILKGGSGDDILNGKGGVNILDSGSGGDTIIIDSPGTHTVYGGTGLDTLSMPSASSSSFHFLITNGIAGVDPGGSLAIKHPTYGAISVESIEKVQTSEATYNYLPINVWSTQAPTFYQPSVVNFPVFGLGVVNAGFYTGDALTHLAKGSSANEIIGLYNDNSIAHQLFPEITSYGPHTDSNGVFSSTVTKPGNAFVIDPSGGNDIIIGNNSLSETIFINMLDYTGTNGTPFIGNLYVYNFDTANDQVKVGVGESAYPTLYASPDGLDQIQKSLNAAYGNLNDGVHLLTSGNIIQIVSDGSNNVLGQLTITYLDAFGGAAIPAASQLVDPLAAIDWITSYGTTAQELGKINSTLSQSELFRDAYQYLASKGISDFKTVVSYSPVDKYSLYSQSSIAALYDLVGNDLNVAPSAYSDFYYQTYPNPITGNVASNDFGNPTGYHLEVLDYNLSGNLEFSPINGTFTYTPSTGDLSNPAGIYFSYTWASNVDGQYVGLPGIVEFVLDQNT